jgi:hypothetical protein
MVLGIMQPYFLPYIGYYSLIKHTDKWIIFDVVQFIRHGWIERNRVLKPGEGWQYISVPLQKHSRDTLIKDILVRTEEDWQQKLLRQLEHYKKKAPYYRQTIEVLTEGFEKNYESINHLNANLLEATCTYLQIPFQINIFSEMNLQIEPVLHSGQWALNICKSLDATEYINPPGGIELFDKKEFKDSNIKLSFLKNKVPEYSQRRNTFEPGLSIVDVMMFNDVQAISQMLNDYEIIH